MSKRLDTAARSVFGLVIVVVLFWLQWRSDLQHPDWQVWEASNNLFDVGANPYDPLVLNQELQSDVLAYGDHFNNDQQFMYLSNPPSWLATIRFYANSTFLVAFAGTLAMAASIVALTKDRPFIDTMAGMAGMFVFAYLSPGASTFLFGQAGLFLAGMVSLHVAFMGRTLWGIPVALLSSKPHFAFAAGIVALVRDPKRISIRIAVPYALLVLTTTALIGARSWLQWVDAIANNALPESTLSDMSIGSLHPALPWRDDLGLVGVLIGLALSAGFAWYGRRSDPIPVAFASLAIAVYLSGHAFMHDWMWLAIVPVAMKWSPPVTLLGLSSIGLALTARNSVPQNLPLDYQSSIGLLITIGLVAIALRSIRNAGSQTPETEVTAPSEQAAVPA